MPRIQKKDAKNNQFSQNLQTWFFVAHPQKIDTTTIIKSDTTSDTTWSNHGQWANSSFLDSLKHISTLHEVGIGWDRQKTEVFNPGIFYWGDTVEYPKGSTVDTIRESYFRIELPKLSTGYLRSDGVWSAQHDIKYITKTIRDSVFTTKVDQSQVNALKTQLQTSRDSVNNYMIRYANESSTASKRLLWIIILSILIGLSGFFNFKNLFKL